MRTRKDKAAYIAEAQKKIKAYKELFNLYNTVYVETLNKFDGKVYNKRFTNAVQEQLPPRFYIKVEGGRMDEKEGLDVEMYRLYDDNYNKLCSIHFKLCFTWSAEKGNRISMENSVTNQYTEAWLASSARNMENVQDSIDNYDTYMAKAESLVAMIKDFNAMPFEFRNNLEKYDFYIYVG